MDVTVCVATYRRPVGLARLLASLGRMKLPDDTQVEVVVVDNDPAAQDPAQPLAAGSLPVRRLREPRRNIAHARNAAVRAARGRWLAFVDDDEEVHESWLAAHLAQRDRTPCDGLFGPVAPRPLDPGAGGLEWLGFFERGPWQSGERVPLGAAATNNAFLRRQLFEAAAFDPEFGLSGGEDTRLFAELVARGAELRWCQEARVEEWVPPERLRASWLLRRAFRGGNVHARMARRGAGGAALAAALVRALAICVAATALVPFAALQRPSRALRAVMRVSSAVGRVWGLLGGRYEEYSETSGEAARREPDPRGARS